MKTKKKGGTATLTAAQIEIVRKFKGYSSKNPELTFEQVSLQELGRNPFLKTLNGKKFRRECLLAFSGERASASQSQ
jgi:hypothetical protein